MIASKPLAAKERGVKEKQDICQGIQNNYKDKLTDIYRR
jgi:hypothetical protein